MTSGPWSRATMGKAPSHSPKRAGPLRDRVYEALEELIIYGSLAPGQHLVEADIAKMLGVSRIPVREGLQLLARDGWIDLRPGQGAFVHQPEMSEVDDVFSVRTLLEVESTRLAATRATDASIQDLRMIVEAGSDALARADEKELVMLNSQFHAHISRIGDNQVLAGLIARLDKRIRWYFAPVVRTRGSNSWKEHRAIAEAIAARDPRRASEAMQKHAEATRSAYLLEESERPLRESSGSPEPPY